MGREDIGYYGLCHCEKAGRDAASLEEQSERWNSFISRHVSRIIDRPATAVVELLASRSRKFMLR